MSDRLTRAIALIHQSGRNLPKRERDALEPAQLWRVKNWIKHPFDPGWDDGLYCKCHIAFRNAKRRQKGEIVVDCVNDGNLSKGYPVRSYFEISQVANNGSDTGGRLTFLEYCFADGEPYRFRRKIGPRGTRLTQKELVELKGHPYQTYKVSPSNGPASISTYNWNKMLNHKKRRQDQALIIISE